MFADLSQLFPVERSILAASARHPAADPELALSESRRYGQLVGRNFARFAFPNDVVPWLQPLREVVLKKATGQGFESAALKDVIELRLESSNGWAEPPFALVLVVVTAVGVLPGLDDEAEPAYSAGIAEWLNSNPGSAEIAERLYDGRHSAFTAQPGERAQLWNGLAEAWARRCFPRDRVRTTEVMASVQGQMIAAEVVTADEFSLARAYRSELIDFEQLSPPRPD